MMTQEQLISLMTASKTPYFSFGKETYVFLGAEREDGSGKCFNVRAYNNKNEKVTLFVRIGVR